MCLSVAPKSVVLQLPYSPPFRVGLLDLKSSPLLLLLLLLLPSLQKQQIYPTAEAPVRIDGPSQIGGPDIGTQILNFQKKTTQNSNIRVFLKGDVFLLKKKRPLPGMHETVVRACFHQKSKIQGILTKMIQFPEKVREAK